MPIGKGLTPQIQYWQYYHLLCQPTYSNPHLPPLVHHLEPPLHISPLSSVSPPTIHIPTSPFRRSQPLRNLMLSNLRPTGAPASTRGIGKSIAAKLEMYNRNKLLQTHINFSRFLSIYSDFLEQLSHLAPIIRNHQMPKSPHSPDSLTSWVPCVLQCTSCLPHIGLTNHTWHTALHMFTLWLTYAHCLPHPILMVSFPSIIQLY